MAKKLPRGGKDGKRTTTTTRGGGSTISQTQATQPSSAKRVCDSDGKGGNSLLPCVGWPPCGKRVRRDGWLAGGACQGAVTSVLGIRGAAVAGASTVICDGDIITD